MSYDPAIPLASDSPSVFPAQSQGNFTQIKKIVEADHQFNLTASANDGYHNLIHMTQQSPSTTPIAVTGRLYSKLSEGFMELFFMDDTPTTSKNYQITPTMPIRAAVNFTNTTPNSAYNVSGVTNPSAGVYTITFSTAMPNATYIVQVTGQIQSAGANEAIIGSVANDGGSWGNAIQTGKVTVVFTKLNGSLAAPTTGHVTIFSVT